jgi:hypothetical protein
MVAGLRYADAEGVHPGELATAMHTAAMEALGGPADLWHIHNHSLGKNPALTAAVSLLAADGQRLLLQIHDFAEDDRPRNYAALLDAFDGTPSTGRGELVYPQADHVHYAVLNPRDLEFLGHAGVDPSRLHLVGNPVDAAGRVEPDDKTPQESAELVLYPVRAIRRKNLGEFLLWAAADAAQHRFAVTLAPVNPEAQSSYQRWMRVARELALPIAFDAAEGGRRPLCDLLEETECVITTSVAEGFGMAFLEPWVAGLSLTGRNLPDTTAAFVDHGVRLDALYERLEIPVAWIDPQELGRKIEVALRRSRSAYRRPVTAEDVARAVDAAVRHDRADFGRLDEGLQETIIRRLAAQPGLRAELRPSSPFTALPRRDRIGSNAKAVRRHYGPETFGVHLARLYERVASSRTSGVGGIEAGRLLDRFLDPARFRLLMA